MATPKAKELAHDGSATVAEACVFLKIKKTTLYLLMETRVLPYARVARKRLIPWKALREYVAKSLDRINNL